MVHCVCVGGVGGARWKNVTTLVLGLCSSGVSTNLVSLPCGTSVLYFSFVRSGLGYIVGSEMAHVTGSWQWGLRVTPIIGVIAVLLVIFVMHDPVRGNSEGSHLRPTTWGNDLSELCKK